MIRRLQPGRPHRNYKGEIAKEIGATLRNSLLHSSRLGTLVVRMGVEGEALDLVTEAHEQAKYTAPDSHPSPMLSPATSGESKGIPIFLARGECEERIQGSPRPELIAFAT
jgi:hypothetical protein